ncbi:MAG: hypothetical protein SFV81_20700, partial [Pirellulaceae bacterium]|nr:hypothetical protein [Pirellulaceae bacterium]
MADELLEKREGPESVFPLPLSPIEKFFFWDDRPEQPLTAFFHLSFESSVDVSLLESCIAQVLERNPLLRAHVTGSDDNLAWILSDKPFRLSSLQDEPPIQDGKVRPIDLRKEVGCRFWCESAANCSRITAQLHHSACDGIAFRNVCIDILHLYMLATTGKSEAVPDRDLFYQRYVYPQLHDRHKFEHLGKPKRETTTWQRIKHAWYFHLQPPVPLANPVPFGSPVPLASKSSMEPKCAAGRESSNTLCNLLVDRELSECILRACQLNEVGINEAAIAILFQTCYQWNRQHGDTRRNARLRVVMPYDLRGRTDVRMPATNRLGLCFLGRNYSQCENLDELIGGLQNELKAVKDTHLYLDLLKGIELGCKWPRVMKWALRKHKSMATVALTYTGDLSR